MTDRLNADQFGRPEFVHVLLPGHGPAEHHTEEGVGRRRCWWWRWR